MPNEAVPAPPMPLDSQPPSPPPSAGSVAALVLAAGQGLRAGQNGPKQFALWRGKPVLRHSVEALATAGVSPILITIPAGNDETAQAAVAGIPGVQFIQGGITRQDSVRLGLDALASGAHGAAPDHVLIHDAARPALPQAVIIRLLTALAEHSAAIPVLPVVDSLCHADGQVMGAPARREALRRVQTPQAFRFADILAAHRAWEGDTTAGDDAQVAQYAGLAIALVEGDEALHKLTFSSDFARSPGATGGPAPVRTGTGFDVHTLADGEELWLCGIRIVHNQGLVGHSDADVAIHALVDAILGAAAAGDIGQHFPPSDPQWRGASSDRFLAHAVALAHEAGYTIGNVDITLICEAPRIGAHRSAMRQRLAEIIGISIDAVSVKATTTEKLGFAGRGEGIAAQASATLILI